MRLHGWEPEQNLAYCLFCSLVETVVGVDLAFALSSLLSFPPLAQQFVEEGRLKINSRAFRNGREDKYDSTLFVLLAVMSPDRYTERLPSF